RDRDRRLLQRIAGGRRRGGRGAGYNAHRRPGLDLRPDLRLLPDETLPGHLMSATAPAADRSPAARPQGEVIVEFDHTWKRYSGRDVLAGVNLKIRRGEVLCVLGPSGTGKSVTLRHINGLTQPDEGDVRVFGESVVGLTEEQLAPVRRRITMLFQGGALFDSMN